MTNSGVEQSDTSKLFPEDMAKSDDVEDPSASQLQSDLPRSRYKRVVNFWDLFNGSSHDQPPPWQAQLGFYLSCFYLVGSIAIIAYYLRSFTNEGGRPTVVDRKYVSNESVQSGSMDDYICSCNLPPEITSQLDEDDTRISTFNRCYDPKDPEQVRSVNVLQFLHKFVSDMIKPINTKRIIERQFEFSYVLHWQSYELQTSSDSYSNSTDPENPLAKLSGLLTDRGFILDTNGYISVRGLADEPFFTVPQGFIKADVNFTCNSCSKCGEKLWDPYGLKVATLSRLSYKEDAGWIYCYETSGVPAGESPDSKCQGSCRFFQTQYQPWGIALNKFANVLVDLIDVPADTNVHFVSRVLYANVSSFSETNYPITMSFLEIEPTGTSWAKLLDYFEDIPDCIEEKNTAYICNGMSICQLAAVYSADSVNSESHEVACMNYPVEKDQHHGMNKEECDRIVKTLNLTFRVPDRDISALCGAFACERVQASRIYWPNLYALYGEAALSRLVSLPSSHSSYIPPLCANNYSQAHVTYEGKQGDISRIYEVNCTSGKSRGCWLTGWYKNVTDTLNDDWKWHTFTRDDNRSAEQMFACYRFHKMSVPHYLLDKIGIIGGNLGNLSIAASCIYWTASKCLDKSIKRRPRESDAGSGRALNETPSTPTAIGDVD